MSLCKSPHCCWRSVSVHVAWDTQALPQCASKWEVDRNKSKCFSVYVSLSVCISWLGWKSINQSPFWSFFPFSSSWSSKDILSLSISPLLIMQVTTALRWICLQPTAGLVSQIPLCCRQLHDFTRWSHSKRPRGCQPAMSRGVQSGCSQFTGTWRDERDAEAAYLWQEENHREQVGDGLCLCMSPPPSSSIWRLSRLRCNVSEFAPYLASHSLAHVYTHSVCHTLPQGTLMWT